MFTIALSLKAAHVIFVIAWMAGMLIYPRYKIHQLSSTPGEPLFETMKEASARLKRIILTPSMLIVWVIGLGMIAYNPLLITNGGGWLHAKLLLVLALTGLHGYFSALGRKIDNGTATVTPKTMRLLNEVPFILMIVIVILAVVRPF